MTDNSDLQTKIKVRSKGLNLIKEPLTLLEMYGGEGVLTSNFWVHKAENITVYEKQKGKYLFANEKVTLFECDNVEVKNINKYNIIDLDAYGLVQKKLELVRNVCKENTLIFFTEFNPYAQKRFDWQSKFIEFLNSLNPICYYVEKSKYGQAIYGYIYV